MPLSTNPAPESGAKKALWYAAAAGAVMGLGAPAAQAQIIYQDLEPDLDLMDTGEAPADSPFTIDIDGDGDAELLIWEDNGRAYAGSNFIGDDGAGEGPDRVTAIVGTLEPFAGTDYAYYLPMEAGSTVSSGAATAVGYYSTLATFTFGGTTGGAGDPNGLIGIGDTYIGVEFMLDETTTHYAWIRIEMPEPGRIIYKDLAYNATPSGPIAAGDMGTVSNEAGPLLSGARLSAAYPNPFASEARFNLEVARAQDVTVEVFDVLGRSVQVLHDGTLTAGTNHDFALRGAELPNGVYLVRASGEEFKETRTVTLAR